MIFEHRFLNTEPRISRPDYPEYRLPEEVDDESEDDVEESIEPVE